jgi:FkbM family methyltransferase
VMFLRKLQIAVRRVLVRRRARGFRATGEVVAIPPCYAVAVGLSPASVVVDCGTGPDADFSQAIISRFGSRCHGVEPTRKHHHALDEVVAASEGRFTYVSRALAATGPRLPFHESQTNVSGSLLDDHLNVRWDRTVTYEVETVDLEGLLELLGITQVDVLKLDVEGAEYALLSAVAPATLQRIGQLIVEFHDHCVARFSPRDTRRIIRRLERAGFTSYSVDAINYLFFRPATGR